MDMLGDKIEHIIVSMIQRRAGGRMIEMRAG